MNYLVYMDRNIVINDEWTVYTRFIKNILINIK